MREALAADEINSFATLLAQSTQGQGGVVAVPGFSAVEVGPAAPRRHHGVFGNPNGTAPLPR